MKYLFVFILLLVFIAPVKKADAIASVGIGTGKINVPDTLLAGSTTELSSVAVYNTGDTAGKYSMSVTFNERQDENKPEAEWVDFSPKDFVLLPGEAQVVTITLRLPSNLTAGMYHAYLEATSKDISSEGTGNIGAAAASKLYFTAAGNPAQKVVIEQKPQQSIDTPEKPSEQVPRAVAVPHSNFSDASNFGLVAFGINRMKQMLTLSRMNL